MSRIGKKPVPLPEGVKIARDGRMLSAVGAKGTLSLKLDDEVSINQENGQITVAPVNASRRARAMWGMQRQMIANMVKGVSEGFTAELEISGVGMRAQVQGKNLRFNLGVSHEVSYPMPEGITIAAPRPVALVISGADKQKVGQTAAEIRAFRPPEPYKGKGIRRAGEYVFRKEGKKK